MGTKNIPYGGSLPYRKMCRYQSGELAAFRCSRLTTSLRSRSVPLQSAEWGSSQAFSRCSALTLSPKLRILLASSAAGRLRVLLACRVRLRLSSSSELMLILSLPSGQASNSSQSASLGAHQRALLLLMPFSHTAAISTTTPLCT